MEQSLLSKRCSHLYQSIVLENVCFTFLTTYNDFIICYVVTTAGIIGIYSSTSIFNGNKM